MKYYYCFLQNLLLFLLLSNISLAQKTNQNYSLNAQYLFNTFQKGYVYTSNGNKTNADLNYNVLLEEVHFIKNGKILALKKNDVDSVMIYNRIFQLIDWDWYEKNQTGDFLLLKRRVPDMSVLNSDGIYGTQSNSSTKEKWRTYTTKLVGITNIYQINQRNDNNRQIPINEQLFIFHNDKIIPTTRNKIAKLVPEHKKEIKNYIKSKELDLEKTEDITHILQYISKNF